MKKRVGATLLTGAMLGTCAMGLAGCGGLTMPKGDSVPEEKWVAAFEKMEELENYTLSMEMNVECEISGTVTTVVNQNTDKKKTVSTEGKAKISGGMTVLYDVKGNKEYEEYNTSVNASGMDDGEKQSVKAKETSKKYYELCEEKEGRKSYWRVGCGAEDYKSSDADSKKDSHEERFWDAYETTTFASDYMDDFSISLYETNSKENNVSKSIVDLYSKFVYSDGVYVASLYQYVDISGNYGPRAYDYIPCTVKVSFDGTECCLKGLSIHCKGEGNAFEKDKYNINYSYTGSSVYTVTEVGTTDVTQKIVKSKDNEDIVKAIAKARTKKEESNG